MAKRIIKKVGGKRLGDGPRMKVTADGFGYSTSNLSMVRRTSMAWGTIVPMGQFIMLPGSRARIELDSFITSSALKYQLYGSGKFQIDIFEAPLALYNPLMNLNFMDQGFGVSDIKLPLIEVKTNNIDITKPNLAHQQINESALLKYLRINGNGQGEGEVEEVTREHMSAFVLMYYQCLKEYYNNKQEKVGYVIHNTSAPSNVQIIAIELWDGEVFITDVPIGSKTDFYVNPGDLTEPNLVVRYNILDGRDESRLGPANIGILWGDINGDNLQNPASEIWTTNTDTINLPGGNPKSRKITFTNYQWGADFVELFAGVNNQAIAGAVGTPELAEYDLKAIDRMTASIHANLLSGTALKITENSEFPYSGSLKKYGDFRSINGTQEGLGIACYESDVFNNYLDNATVNSLNARNKIKVDDNGEFTIDNLNITQKLYNHDMRLGITDGTIEEWQEMTYGVLMKSKSTKPVYAGGLIKEIVFNQVVSTASTDEQPLGAIASRGQFGNKHQGGRAVVEADEYKLVLINAVCIPRIVYNQGNAFWTNLKTLDDFHKPILDKIGYQNLLTDTMACFDTVVKNDGTLVMRSVGKQPAWQWYKTNYDDALGNMAYLEDYKVFGRSYEAIREGAEVRIKDLTTYIDPVKYNDIWAVESLDAMHFDVEVGIRVTMTQVMSEEVIPTI